MPNRNIDKFGRSAAIGTRRIWSGRAKCRGQERPLPFDLQTHPQRAYPRRLSGTVCFTQAGWYVYYLQAFREGRSPRFGPRIKLAAYLTMRDGRKIGYFSDPAEGMGYVNAANAYHRGEFKLVLK